MGRGYVGEKGPAMITQLKGEVLEIGVTSLTIDVGGVGFSVACTPATAAGVRLGETARLHTHLAVREDALTLFGFSSPAEREAFLLAQSVTGIGPKLALAIVSHLTAAQLRQAILTENRLALAKVPGVGQKTASRLVLELKDKVAGLEGPAEQTVAAPQQHEQVVLGLEGLGYSARDAEAAWDAIAAMSGDPVVSVSELMRAALRSLARG